MFQRLRRLGGLRTEVLLLLVAEVVALHYYSTLRDGVGDPTPTKCSTSTSMLQPCRICWRRSFPVGLSEF